MSEIINFVQTHAYLVHILRILLALLLGFIIGFERKSRSKEAGIRTHAIVAVGAALFTLISKHGFSGDFDSSRIAAQVVAGVGFLGAGMIMHQRQAIHGLTTAAGIWATAGVGMAAAAGMWQVAIGATVLIVGIQMLLHADIKLFRMKRTFSYSVSFYDEDGATETILNTFGVEKFSKLKTERRNDRLHCVAVIRTDKELTDDDLKSVVSLNTFVISCESFSNDVE